MTYALPYLQPSLLIVVGSVAIYLSILTLIILVVSLVGVKEVGRLGYMGLFLASMGVASVVYVIYGVLVVIDPVKNTAANQYLVTVSDSLYEFGFSIVNLTLKDLSSMLQLDSRRLEVFWLLYNVGVFVMNIILTVIQREINNPEQVLFWNGIFAWATQTINLIVFFYYRRRTIEYLGARAISEATNQMLSTVMARFTEYCLVYALFVLSYFWLALGTLLDILHAWDKAVQVISLFGFGTHQTFRFFAFVYALKIYKPWWARWIEVTKTLYSRTMAMGMATNLSVNVSMNEAMINNYPSPEQARRSFSAVRDCNSSNGGSSPSGPSSLLGSRMSLAAKKRARLSTNHTESGAESSIGSPSAVLSAARKRSADATVLGSATLGESEATPPVPRIQVSSSEPRISSSLAPDFPARPRRSSASSVGNGYPSNRRSSEPRRTRFVVVQEPSLYHPGGPEATSPAGSPVAQPQQRTQRQDSSSATKGRHHHHHFFPLGREKSKGALDSAATAVAQDPDGEKDKTSMRTGVVTSLPNMVSISSTGSMSETTMPAPVRLRPSEPARMNNCSAPVGEVLSTPVPSSQPMGEVLSTPVPPSQRMGEVLSTPVPPSPVDNTCLQLGVFIGEKCDIKDKNSAQESLPRSEAAFVAHSPVQVDELVLHSATPSPGGRVNP